MKLYTIFDDFPDEAVEELKSAGIQVTVHPTGVPRPNADEMSAIVREYDIVIIGTSQKLTEEMLSGVDSPRMIGTASVGTDHIQIPEGKEKLFTVFNTPFANGQSVAEYTMGCALSCIKRMREGNQLYLEKKNNKQLHQKPEDLRGKTMGVVGAGHISRKIMEYAAIFGMQILCWTAHPERHSALLEKGVQFVLLEELARSADVVSVNLPNNAGTKNIIDSAFVDGMKENAVFISVSRLATVDWEALLRRAERERGFYVCLDIDMDERVAEEMPDLPNVMITPHIAGGTVETRRRMFMEVASQIAEAVSCG